MTMIVRRSTMWLLILAVALASAYVGFQLSRAQPSSPSDRSVGIHLLRGSGGHQGGGGHNAGGNVPPSACYKTPPNGKNKHC